MSLISSSLYRTNAARLVTREKKSSHVTPLLKQLHWLPIEYRIKYKIILIVYKCLHEMGSIDTAITAHRLLPKNIYVSEIR